MRKKAKKITLTDKEIPVNTDSPIMVKTDIKGIIEYANEYFIELSGYEIGEIIGKDISVMVHPSMPSTIFDHVWENILTKQNTKAIIKNITKKGDFFWLQARFDFRVNEITREIENIYVYYEPASKMASSDLDKLYLKIANIEKHSGIDIAENYFSGFLEQKSHNYNSFIESYFQ